MASLVGCRVTLQIEADKTVDPTRIYTVYDVDPTAGFVLMQQTHVQKSATGAVTEIDLGSSFAPKRAWFNLASIAALILQPDRNA